VAAAGLGDFVWMRLSCSRFLHAARDEDFWLGFHSGRLRLVCGGHSGLGFPGRIRLRDYGLLLRGAAPGLRRLSLLYRAAKECGVNPEPFLQLDRVIHEKGRLAIMSMLAASPELSFTEMRDALAMTDGNLTTHIRTLQEAGYVSITKSFQNNRPHTTCSLTASGKKAFTNYINLLESIIQQTKGK